MRRPLLAAAVASLLAAAAAAAGSRPLPLLHAGAGLGPPGGEVRSLALAPSDPSRLYAGSANGHLYVSGDGGLGWVDCSPPLPHDAVIDNLVVDPRDADVAFAAFWRPDGSGGLLRTRDGGSNWWGLRLPGAPSLRALALAPSRPDTVYAGGLGGLWRSDDGGDSFDDASGGGRCRLVESLAVDPREPLRVYAGTWRLAYHSTDGGAAWQPLHAGMNIDRDVFALAISPHDPDLVLAGTCGFVYSSRQGGRWTTHSRGIDPEHRRVHALTFHPGDPAVVFAGTRGALYRSTDGGSSYQSLLAGVSVTAMAIDRLGGRLYLASEERGVLVGDPAGGFREINRGIGLSRVVAFDAVPDGFGTMVVARTEQPDLQSILASTDGGSNWAPVARLRGVDRVRILGAGPQAVAVSGGAWWQVGPGADPRRLVAPPGRLGALAVARRDPPVLLAATDRGLFALPLAALEAGGRPEPRWIQLQGGNLRAVAVAGERFLAVGSGLAVRGLLDGAHARIDVVPAVGLPDELVDLALDPGVPGLVGAVTAGSVLISEDSGASWIEVALPWPAIGLRQVAADPASPGRLVALDSRGVLYLGHDRGRRWMVPEHDPALENARELRLSASAPGLAVVATVGHGLRLVSLDGAGTGTFVSGPIAAGLLGRQQALPSR